MIMRVMGEGQYEVGEDHLNLLNELDAELVTAVESGDETLFRQAYGKLIDAVKQFGTPVPLDSLEPSELILPSADATIDEVRELLMADGEGVIPGFPE
ncbi:MULTISPECIES: PspA-associated protein PspAA [unclassified Kitasatospora]|uniref:PspA-associated protein PspAA n=1 Tax=unclassified Kitasatospora TaxID=2633591 RepID=UPI0037107E51